MIITMILMNHRQQVLFYTFVYYNKKLDYHDKSEDFTMDKVIIHRSDFISIELEKDSYYIESYKKGINMNDFNVNGLASEIKITDFIAVKMLS